MTVSKHEVRLSGWLSFAVGMFVMCACFAMVSIAVSFSLRRECQIPAPAPKHAVVDFGDGPIEAIQDPDEDAKP